MAGLNVGMSNWGKFRGSPETTIPKPQPSPTPNMGNGGPINAGPSIPPAMPKPPPIPMGGGINVGRNSMQGILPSPQDPFRQYASVNGGQVTPPQNPYAPPSNLPMGGGAGTYGPINAGPSNPYADRGGFTGGQMPQSGNSAAMTGFAPTMRRPLQSGGQYPMNFGNQQIGGRNQGPLASTYQGGGQDSFNGSPRNNLIY